MSTRHRVSAGLLLAGVLLTLPGAASPAEAPSPVRVTLPPYLSNAPLLLAQAAGYFEARGIRLELVAVERSLDALPALVGGRIDVQPAQISAGLLNAIARGAGVRIVAGKGHLDASGCGHLALVAPPGRARPGDAASLRRAIVGARFSTSKAGLSDYLVDRLLREAEVRRDEIVEANVSAPAEAEALALGRIDLALMGEPWLTRARRAGLAVWKEAPEWAPEFDTAYIVFGSRLLGAERAAGERFLAAYLEGVRDYAEGKTARNVERLAAATGLEPDLLAAACWPQVRVDGEFRLESLASFAAWARARGDLDRDVAPEELVDLAPLSVARRAVRGPALQP